MKKTNSFVKMCNENAKRNNLHWRIDENGHHKFEVNGKWYDASCLDIMFPRYTYYRGADKGNNCSSKVFS